MNRYLFALATLLLLSCNKHKTASHTTKTEWKPIPYDTTTNYWDSIAKKLNPDQPYAYWQYVSFYQAMDEQNYTVLASGGDTVFRKLIDTKIDPIQLNGLFEGGHPNFRSNYLIVVDQKKVRYLDTMTQLRDFIGSVDNLEEALLFARTYGYCMGTRPEGRSYSFSNNTFTLHLVKFSEHFPETLFQARGELVALSITKDGFMKTKSLGIYCQGKACLNY